MRCVVTNIRHCQQPIVKGHTYIFLLCKKKMKIIFLFLTENNKIIQQYCLINYLMHLSYGDQCWRLQEQVNFFFSRPKPAALVQARVTSRPQRCAWLADACEYTNAYARVRLSGNMRRSRQHRIIKREYAGFAYKPIKVVAMFNCGVSQA